MNNLLGLRIRKVFLALQSGVGRRALLRHRVLGAFEHIPVLQRAYDLVLDVGANRGQFAIATRSVLPAAEIVAFEPLSAPYDIAVAVFVGDQNISLFKCALGDVECTQPMNISRSDDSSSLLPIAVLQSDTFPGTERVGVASVEVKRLDDAIVPRLRGKKVLLKIDTQGYELAVLKGAAGVLAHIGDIYCECSFRQFYEGQPLFSDVAQYLMLREFDLTGVFNPSYDENGQCLQADFLFSRRNHNTDLTMVDAT